jgi:pimeloyl-ACP methyl ester carboxylesterase
MIGHEVFGGGAEKVIVFHGWGLDHKAFSQMLPALDGQAFTFAFMDYRGCGLSKEQSGSFTIEEIANDAIELVEHLKWESFHMVGHSMGGMVVQWIAASHTKRVKSAIAVTPVPACGAPTMDDATRDAFCRIGDTQESLAAFFLRGTGNRHCPAWGKSLAETSLVATAHEAYAKYTMAWSKTNFVQKVLGLPTPLKTLVGDHDPTITAEAMQQTIMKWFPKAELETLSNCGHYPMLEIPINLATIWQTFMSAHT